MANIFDSQCLVFKQLSQTKYQCQVDVANSILTRSSIKLLSAVKRKVPPFGFPLFQSNNMDSLFDVRFFFNVLADSNQSSSLATTFLQT